MHAALFRLFVFCLFFNFAVLGSFLRESFHVQSIMPDNHPVSSPKPTLTPFLLWLMTISSGLIIANNYYNQPLLSMMAKDFGISEAQVSTIPMLTQMGYATGLLIIIPLGDMFRRKRMIQIDFIFIVLALAGMYLSRNVNWLFPLSFIIGFTSVIPQIFIPIAAELSLPEKKTAAVGQVMSGLLIGILLSRVISGFVGIWLGWRVMYLFATITMVMLWVLISWKLPEIYPHYKGSYRQLMQSVWKLARGEKILRLASFRGATGFAAFSAFWTTLVFHLENPPFFAGSDVAGMFGLVGGIGALAAAFVGKLTIKTSSERIIFYSILMMMLGWGCFYGGATTYTGLVAGVILIDMGLQSMHVMNQSAIFSINTSASNRINTVYMTSYFIGGSIGTLLAAQAWSVWQWNGVIVVGTVFTLLTLLAHLLSVRAH